jgi:hypothetical protein
MEIGSARGGRRPSPEIIIEIIRALGEEDLERLVTPDPIGTTPIPTKTLRASHHQLAQLLAQGRGESEAALITGYSPSRISILKSDPAFQELLASYTEIRQNIFVDTLERMKILGLSTMDELQERLETAPERWSNRELMEMADLMLVKPRQANPFTSGASGPPVGVAIQVQFVKSSTPALIIEGEKAKILNE